MAFGLLFSFHYSQIPILAVIFLAFWIKRKHFGIKDYLKFALGLALSNITVLIYDAGQGFTMIKNLFLWIPYRFAGFFGIYPKNNLDAATGGTTLSSFNEFFGRNLFWDSRFWILGSAVFVVLFLIFVAKNYKNITKDFFVFYLTTSTAIQCLGLLILTAPPLHYFFPIFLNFGLLFSYFALDYWHKKSTKILTVLIVVLMSVAGLMGMSNEHSGVSDYIPFKIQDGVSNSIVNDAGGRPFSLIRVGPFDYFPENYSQNYKYLLLEKGGKIDPSAKLQYIIYDIGTVYVQKNEKP
jgi:hypothetical protein